ncbi:MAG: P-loop NTPase [Dehalococcoidia bacterium]
MDERLYHEAAVRDVLTALLRLDGAPLLAADDITAVQLDDDWIVVTLGGAAAGEAAAAAGETVVVRRGEGISEPRADDLLRQIHVGLRAAFPEAQTEVRAGREVYRGGAGFGDGKHVVAVLGGKGGVGKSTLAVNLALTLSAMGMRVGLIDGDLNGPDIPHLLGIPPDRHPSRLRTRSMGEVGPAGWRRPLERFGVEVLSVGLEVPERFPPVISTRQLVSQLLRGFIFQTAWSADILVIDAPPGTGEELQVMARELPLSGVVFITTPQDLAQMDAERTLTLMRERGVPVIGMVQNMASLICPHCDEAIDLYSLSSRLADAGVSVLGRIPFDVQLSVTADQGRPLVLGDPRGPIAYEFARIGAAVRRWLAATRLPEPRPPAPQ